jgi:poly-gamma-glutamate synthesis protein (capsule biosynthesis protein)
VTQGAESYKGKPILYSLGNFVFDGFDTEATRTGWLARLTVSKRGILHWETLVARLDPRGSPAPDLQAMSPCGDASGVPVPRRKTLARFEAEDFSRGRELRSVGCARWREV